MIEFTLYTANCTGNLANCLYPNKVVIKDKASFIETIKFDHVSAEYKGNYRSNANFIKADNNVFDCDNDHSDDPKDWVTPADVATAFPGVPFAVSYSRNHMKQKGNKSPRPRFHVYLAIPVITDPKEYAALKLAVASRFPFFDTNALDSARFIFGSDNGKVELFEGDTNIVEFLEDSSFADWDDAQEEIPQGQRNNTMSRYAGRIIKRFGNTEEAHSKFLALAEKCNPPLEEKELQIIWNSAVSFGEKVAAQAGYIPPEVYNSDSVLKPSDFSDVGQAVVLAREYEDKLRYSPATDFIVYNGSFWEESKPKAQAIAQELTTRQLKEARAEMKKAMDKMEKNGALDILADKGPKKAIGAFDGPQSHAFEMYEAADAYRKYAIKRRDSKFIAASLKEAQPMLEIRQNDLDTNEFLLNTPKATYDLRTGARMKHDPAYFITKETAVEPSKKGLDKWKDALNTFFLNDKSLIDYVQKVVGLAAVGKVYVEALIIAHGEGRNGKSTFWNAISRVLGTYSGNISADILTVGCRRNVKPELAEAKGKRLLIAAEMEEGMRLNTSNVKQLCSTDEINAEKKYKDPFSYIPSHTLVLYTNHLPKVGALDTGTWRRLIVIPFAAKIEGSADIKNYGDYLFEQAGGAILSWIIEGAKKVIKDDYQIELPEKVKDAISAYKENNDWLAHFLEECCEIDKTFTEKSGELYSEYRAFCMRTGEYIRSTTDFYTALDITGFMRHRKNTGVIVRGLRLKSDFLE
ncbi:Phage/plasmid primase, P4 domain-containing protein [Desulfitobacterium hafniense]|uniref:Phage/plasmid primase, P4 domain-containing protein n=1 Tax=Desulfitobacterium hafniense TaxID=49338 RepID=A0A098B3L4_DESHA|nr:phage/plasmid primase, P4 family [Desulfitobacterium hafniense]CDX03453.1 Phage/plasmid primase, P4 domain-containing protein [Desulfitobacterium hafniense]